MVNIRKMALKFSLCRAYRIPNVSLVDTIVEYVVSYNKEFFVIIRITLRMISQYVALEIPTITALSLITVRVLSFLLFSFIHFKISSPEKIYRK